MNSYPEGFLQLAEKITQECVSKHFFQKTNPTSNFTSATMMLINIEQMTTQESLTPNITRSFVESLKYVKVPL